MTIYMGLLENIQILINEHGSSAVLRERLLLLREQIEKLTNEITDLNKKLSDSQAEIVKLQKQLSEKTASEEYVEHKGALFKRKSSGGYDSTVYCPLCRVPLASFQNVLPYHCSRFSVTPEMLSAKLFELDPMSLSLFYDRIGAASFALRCVESEFVEIPESWYTLTLLLLQQKTFQ